MGIRQVDTQDYQQLLELLQLLNPDDPRLSAEHGRAVFDQITQSVSNRIWVMERGDTLLGSIYLSVLNRH